MDVSSLIPAPTMAASKYKDKDGGVLLSFNGVWVSWLHTIVAYSKRCSDSLYAP